MKEERPAIPSHIKREVRQQCHFGCAICGMPFFEYDHIEEYSTVHEHTADNLVLLCPTHHAAKTTGKLSKERIAFAKSQPYNSIRTQTSSFKIEPSKEIEILLGTNIVSGWFPRDGYNHYAIWINGSGYLTIHVTDGWLSFSLNLTDVAGNTLVAVNDGELTASTDNWDFTYEGDTLQVRAGLGKIMLDLSISDSQISVRKGMFIDSTTKEGFEIIDGRIVCVPNGSSFEGCVSQSNGMGAWGLLNRHAYKDIESPSGFGFFLG